MGNIDFNKELKNFLDSYGCLVQYPAKYKLKILSLCYLASKFEDGKNIQKRKSMNY